MSVQAKDFLKDIMPRLPGITEEFCLQEIAAAIREFCEDGRAWTEVFGPLSSAANNPTIYLDPLFQNARTGYVWRATFQSDSNARKVLSPIAALPLYVPSGTEPNSFLMSGPGTVQLNPTPDKDWPDAYLFDLTVIPTTVATRLPDTFMSHWRDAIIDGTCARTMNMISKPWSNAKQAVYHERRFRNFVKRARAITSAKYSTGQAWAFPDFAKQRVGESFI